MATLRKRNGKWQVQVRRKGMKGLSKSFHSKHNANKWAMEMELALERGDCGIENTSLMEHTFNNLIEKYIEELLQFRKSQPIELGHLKRISRQPFANMKLKQLTPLVLQSYVIERSKSVKPGTIQREISVIRNILNIAMRVWGYPLKTNPVVGVKCPPVRQFKVNRVPEKTIETLINGCSHPYMRWVIVLAVETGMRRGEIVGLKWTDIDFSKCLIHLTDTKNGHSRFVPLSDRAVEALEHGDKQHEYVFPMTGNAVRLAWERLKKKHNIEGVRFHDLRHEAISRMFDEGMTIPQIAAISGHRTVSMLFRYAHVQN